MSEESEQLHIEQIRADIARKTQEILFEPRKYRLQFAGVIISVVIGSLAAGGVIGGTIVNYLNGHQPAPIIIQVPK